VTASVASNRVEDARKASTLFYRETELPPGSYTVEVVAWDSKAAAAGVARTDLEVAPSGNRLGSLVVVRQAEPLKEKGAGVDHALRYGDVLLYPNFGEPVRRRYRPPRGQSAARGSGSRGQ
jgi:hypothetical protein